MKIALYENLNKAFEEYNAMHDDNKLCWYELLDGIEDKESTEEIIGVINSLKFATEIRRIIKEKQGELSETITRIYNKKMQEKK